MPQRLAYIVALVMLVSGCSAADDDAASDELASQLDAGSESEATLDRGGRDAGAQDAEADTETGPETNTETDAAVMVVPPGGEETGDVGEAGTSDSAQPSTSTTPSQQGTSQQGTSQQGASQQTTSRQTTPKTPEAGTTVTRRTATTTPPTSDTDTTTKPTDSGGENPPSADLTWGTDPSRPAASWSKPALNTTYSDPAYGTPVRRVTSADGTRFNRNTYSRRQAENADGSLFMTYHGSASYHVYSVDSAKLVRALEIHPDSEPQWHPTDPGRIRHLAGANSSGGALQLLETVVASGRTSVIADFTDRIRARIPGATYVKDRAEGSPSIDGNRWAWIIYDANEKLQGIMSYDLSTDTVLGITTELLSENLDWVSMSPTGRYVVAGFWEGTSIYDPDLRNRRVLTNAAEHSDIALDRNGRDTYVYIDFHGASPTAGWLTAIDMATLKRTKIFDLYDDANTSLHISGKGYEKPGWVVVSSYNCKERGAWSCEKVMAVELVDNGRILNLAHTYNCGDGYWTETHAVVNRSFDAVYFNSDAGSCGIDAEVYRLEIPSLP